MKGMNKMENLPETVDKNLLFEPANLTVETIKKYLCPKASDQELLLGLQIAKTFKLNPLKREVYFVKYNDSQPMQVLTGYEVYLKRAERSGKYNGLDIKSEGSVQEGDLKAIVKVYRKDWTNPLTHEAYYSEYVQTKKDFNTGKVEPNTFWKNKPITMIKKVAISQAFRMAFPDEIDGMPYTSDEVIDQERIIDIKDATPSVPTNGNGHAIEAKPAAFVDPNEELLTPEQGKALLAILAQNGWCSGDLKEYIIYELNLSSLKEIKNKHLLGIKSHFSKPKPRAQVSEAMGGQNANAN